VPGGSAVFGKSGGYHAWLNNNKAKTCFVSFLKIKRDDPHNIHGQSFQELLTDSSPLSTSARARLT